MTPEQLATRWDISTRTLANWRAAKPRKGPRFFHIGSRVRYRSKDIEDYERRELIKVIAEEFNRPSPIAALLR